MYCPMRKLIEAGLCLVHTFCVTFIYMNTRTGSDGSIAAYYLNNALRDTAASNAVTAIYLNYRMFDSIFETLILLTSVIAVIRFSWRKKDEE